MKKVYRTEDNRAYWDRRWREAGMDADAFEDLTIYPIRYAERALARSSGRILEIGCGLGRIVKHYAGQGRDIVGMERSEEAVRRINEATPDLDVRVGDATALDFPDGAFDVALAFGVYHNFETGLEAGLSEVGRILADGGRFVISMRPNNIEMHLNELYWRWRSSAPSGAHKEFHKLLVGEKEFSRLLRRHGLEVDEVHYARNVSILYRFGFLRNRRLDDASEDVRRARGYQLNALGKLLDRLMTAVAPYQFCNVLVFEGHKVAT